MCILPSITWNFNNIITKCYLFQALKYIKSCTLVPDGGSQAQKHVAVIDYVDVPGDNIYMNTNMSQRNGIESIKN